MFIAASAMSSPLYQTGMLDRLNHCKSQKGQLTLNCQQRFHKSQTAEICSLFHQIFSKANLPKALPAALPFYFYFIFFFTHGDLSFKALPVWGFFATFSYWTFRKEIHLWPKCLTSFNVQQLQNGKKIKEFYCISSSVLQFCQSTTGTYIASED